MANREIFYFPDWSLFAFFIATVLGVHFANGALGPQPGDAKLSLEETFNPKTNGALRAAVWCLVLLVPKTLFMAFWTVYVRIKNNTFINPEDFDDGDPKVKPKTHDEAVERVRRAHLNDLENVVPGVIVFFAAAILVPGSHTAGWVYPTTFTGLRLLHSAVYAGLAIPHFWRAQVFSLGVACTCGSCNLMMREVM